MTIYDVLRLHITVKTRINLNLLYTIYAYLFTTMEEWNLFLENRLSQY